MNETQIQNLPSYYIESKIKIQLKSKIKRFSCLLVYQNLYLYQFIKFSFIGKYFQFNYNYGKYYKQPFIKFEVVIYIESMNNIQGRYYRLLAHQIIKKHFNKCVTPSFLISINLTPIRKLWSNSMCAFSTVSPSVAIQKGYFFQTELRKIGKPQQIRSFFQKYKEDINKYGKTMYLQFLLQFHIGSARKNIQDQQIKQANKDYDERVLLIYKDLESLTNLNFYEQVLRFSIFRKLQYTFGYTSQIAQKVKKYRDDLQAKLGKVDLDVIDGLNMLSIFTIQHQEKLFQFSCYLIDQHINQVENIPFKSGNILLKRISQGDWRVIRKCKNIFNYFCFKTNTKFLDDKSQMLNYLQRLSKLQLHLVGPLCIPKKIDHLFDFFMGKLHQLNDYDIFKLFECFKYLPLNYNIQVFQKVKKKIMQHNKLNTKLLFSLPYERLTQKQIQIFQEKIINSQGSNIFKKCLYYFYQPYFYKIFTNKFRKDCYYAMLQNYAKENFKNLIHISAYISFIEKFLNKVELYPYIKQQKLLQVFMKSMKAFENNISSLNTYFTISCCVSLLETVHKLNLYNQFNFKLFVQKINELAYNRKRRYKFNNFKEQVVQCVMSHYNAQSPISQQYLLYILQLFSSTKLISPALILKDKTDVIFSIQKSQNGKQKLSIPCQNLFNEINPEDYPAFLQLFIKFEYKNWKSANYIFQKMYQKKMNLQDWINLICVMPLRFITMKVGNLNINLKYYINQICSSKNRKNLNKMLQNVKYTQMILLLRTLSNFNNQIQQFIKIIVTDIIYKLNLQQKKQEQKKGGNINGKQVTIFVTYCLKILKNFKNEQREEIVTNIYKILQKLRKSGRQGLYMKAFYLNFCYSNLQYLKLDEDLLFHMSRQVVETLQNTQNIQNKIDIVLIILKLQCLKPFLSNEQVKQFKHIILQAILNNLINSSSIKQVFGYQFQAFINNEQQIKRVSDIIGDIMKSAYRKDLLKEKRNQFLQGQYLQFFSFIKQKQMIVENISKNMNLGLSVGYMRSLLSVLNKNAVKNINLTKNIVYELIGSTQYQFQQKYQAYFMIQKLFYSFDCPEYQLLRKALHQDMKKKIIQHKNEKTIKRNTQIKNNQDKQSNTMSSNNYQLDKYLKLYVDYGWTMLKNKQKDDVFTFITQFLISNAEKIEKYLLKNQNNQNHKAISKNKLAFLLLSGQIQLINSINQLKAQKELPKWNEQSKWQNKMKLLENSKRFAKLLYKPNFQQYRQLETKIKQEKGRYQYKKKINQFIAEYYVQKNQKNTVSSYGIITIKQYHRSQLLTQNIHIKLNEPFIFDNKKEDIIQENKEEPQVKIALFKSKSSVKSSYLKSSKQQKIQTPIKMNKNQKQQELRKKQQSIKFSSFNGNLKAQKSLFELMTNKKCVIYNPQTKTFYN